MNNILQWEPAKTRIWGNARIENIQRLRDDVSTLADWLNGKADASAMPGKADLAKVVELETRLAEARDEFKAFRQEMETAVIEFRQRLARLEDWAKTGAASLAECQRVDQALRQMEGEMRTAHIERTAQCEAAVKLTNQKAQAADASAKESAAFHQVCTDIHQTMQAKAGEFEDFVQRARQDLNALSVAVETHAAKVEQLAGMTQQVLTECENSVRETRAVQTSVDAQGRDLAEKVEGWLRRGQSHAQEAAQNASLTGSASEFASKLKSDCEGLIQTLQLKSEELSSTWQSTERDFADLSAMTERHATKAAECAERSQEMLSECRNSVQTSSELCVNLQTSGVEIKQHLNRLEEMLREAGQQITASREHRQASQKRDAQRAESEAQLRALAQQMEVRAHEAGAEMRAFRESCGTFWGRLKWLLAGNRPT